MKVIAMVGLLAIASAAQEEGVHKQRVASGTSRERFRVAMARLSLYSICAKANEGDAALVALLDKTRMILGRLMQDEAVEEDLKQFVIGALLSGCKFQWADVEADSTWMLAQRRMTLNFVNVRLGRIIPTLANITSATIVVTPEANDFAHQTVTARLGPRVTLEECLGAITSGTGVTFRIEGDSVILVLPDDRPDGMTDVLRLAREAVTILGVLGDGAVEAVPIIEPLVTHTDRQIAERAKAALKQIRGDGQ